MKKRILALIVFAISSVASAQSFEITEYINVKRSVPEYSNAADRIPYQECWDERVPVTRYNSGPNDTTAGALIGGVAGGVLGHQVGKGHGKDAATIGGAILGTFIGQNMAKQHQRPGYEREYRYEKKCVTKYRKDHRREFIGYKNIGFYKGHKIVKYSDRKLRKIPITITINY